jgi:hypothetical protein
MSAHHPTLKQPPHPVLWLHASRFPALSVVTDGKVCLSLLGTWHGGDEASKWNPGSSSLFQILLSIQGMIFVEVGSGFWGRFASANAGLCPYMATCYVARHNR